MEEIVEAVAEGATELLSAGTGSSSRKGCGVFLLMFIVVVVLGIIIYVSYNS